MVDYTNFFFEHNQPSEELDVTIEIFNMSGARVNVLNRKIYPSGYTSGPIEWNGEDGNGKKIKGGIYIYHVILRSIQGTVLSEGRKLIVIY
jgi:flagellar hook assembly protein FlgD